MTDPIRVGVVGLGYWGPNLARNMNSIDGCELAWCCDADEGARGRWQRVYPDTRFTPDLADLLEYHPGVRQLSDLIRAGELGDVRYIYSQRLNLGKLRADENALWSLGAHDVSVVIDLAGEEPVEASARGEAYVRE